MRMSLSMYHQQQCIICEQSVEAHAAECPAGRLVALQAMVSNTQCPLCRRGTVDINQEDWFECRRCHTQYSRGAIIPWDTSKLEKAILLDFNQNQAIDVYILPIKGHGKIRIDQRIKAASKDVTNARRRAKRRIK